MLAFAVISFLCAALPCALFCANLAKYREPPLLEAEAVDATREYREQPVLFPDLASQTPAAPLLHNLAALSPVSVLIPARNEAAGIAAAISSVLATRGVDFEIVVMDDHSTDDTAAIVSKLAEQDVRIRLLRSAPLPAGWNGKQHACWQLAEVARNPVLCFMDADVRLEPDCLARMALLLNKSNNSLVSGFPRQITGSVFEWLLIPLIHFVLLGFLPVARMRTSTDPAFAAGCGQFLLVHAKAYFRTGGHAAIRETMHDGIRLPRLFREHGLKTDLADLTHLARCRMYTSAAQVWNGLAKNATEGIATRSRIGPISGVLLLGQVWPFFFMSFAVLLLTLAAFFHVRTALIHPAAVVLILAAGICAWLPRFLAVSRFRQDWRSALLHPVGILLLLAIQWYAFLRKLLRRPVAWRDRAYTPSPASKTA